MQTAARREVTRLLHDLRAGSGGAEDRLLDVVYGELRALAGAACRADAHGTLQPTAVVHEAYLRLLQGNDSEWENRRHFFGATARAMRQLLTDYARERRASKRGGDWHRVTLDDWLEAAQSTDIDLIALDDALTSLSDVDPERARVVELRFFAGLGLDETAKVLGVSETTVKTRWRGARAWLRREIDGAERE